MKHISEDRMWEDYRWQIGNSRMDVQELIRKENLTEAEKEAIQKKKYISIPPYIFSLIDFHDENCPIRRQVIPRYCPTYFVQDCLNEKKYSVTSHIVQKYNHRVLFLISNKCAFKCTHCTRTRVNDIKLLDSESLKSSFDVLRENCEINEVILSGGDPFLLEDKELFYILQELEKISHINIVRIGTRIPVALPMRVTTDLLKMLKLFPNIYINIHVNHPKELTHRARRSLLDLANIGCVLGSQTVLLKNINDNEEVLSILFNELLKCKVRPYYLFQCDREIGCEDFVVDLDKGIELINNIQERVSGLGVP